MAKIRTRFAPSPTGDVHIGGIWIAQFGWLCAKQNGGQFVLRIEDTDRQRLVPGAVEKIYEALTWYGLQPDEGPQQGGPYGPYIQSERLERYQRYAQQLVEQGSAYYCFCTPERLDDVRRAQQAAKQPPRYDKHCLSLSPADVQQRRSAGESAVIRLNVPAHGTVVVHDLVRGDVTFRLDQIDDSVLLKSDGWPTYHLAVVVDDHEMEISHVLRAEEWLPSTPKHLLLYQALGWTPPRFAHLPQILGANKKKLSKRDGAASALQFRDDGYVVEAMQNFLGLMGWHPKGDHELLSREQLLQQFRLEEMNPSGAIFDRTKLDWMNGQYIRTMPMDELLDRLRPFWTWPDGSTPDVTWQRAAVSCVRDRLTKLADINEAINFAFPSVWDRERDAVDPSLLIPKKGSSDSAKEALRWMQSWIAGVPEPWAAATLKAKALTDIQAAGKKNGDILWPARVALSLRSASPDVFDLFALLGHQESERRLKSFLD